MTKSIEQITEESASVFVTRNELPQSEAETALEAFAYSLGSNIEYEKSLTEFASIVRDTAAADVESRPGRVTLTIDLDSEVWASMNGHRDLKAAWVERLVGAVSDEGYVSEIQVQW